MSKVITLVGGCCLVLALVLGMAVPALAAPQAPSIAAFEDELIRGEVIAIGDQELVIQSEETEITVTVNEDTTYCQMPRIVAAAIKNRLEIRQQQCDQLRARVQDGQGQGLKSRIRAATAVREQPRLRARVAEVSSESLPEVFWMRCFSLLGGQTEFGDIAVGDEVIILADENNVAKKVVVIKATSLVRVIVSGTVIEISPSFITIDSDSGPQITLFCDDDTVYVLSGAEKLAVEQRVRITYDADGTAKTIVVCPNAS